MIDFFWPVPIWLQNALTFLFLNIFPQKFQCDQVCSWNARIRCLLYSGGGYRGYRTINLGPTTRPKPSEYSWWSWCSPRDKLGSRVPRPAHSSICRTLTAHTARVLFARGMGRLAFTNTFSMKIVSSLATKSTRRRCTQWLLRKLC